MKQGTWECESDQILESKGKEIMRCRQNKTYLVKEICMMLPPEKRNLVISSLSLINSTTGKLSFFFIQLVFVFLPEYLKYDKNPHNWH